MNSNSMNLRISDLGILFIHFLASFVNSFVDSFYWIPQGWSYNPSDQEKESCVYYVFSDMVIDLYLVL